MRIAIVMMMLVAACSDTPGQPDAQLADGKPADSAPPDAMVDAMVDAPPPVPMNITTACMHACDALGVCFMEPAEPQCYTECAEDLGDCTAEQIQAVDDCSTVACGAEGAGVITCLEVITCINP
jgi:hypothetical protein